MPPEIFTDEEYMKLPIPARLTAIGLRLHADDHGRETTTTFLLKASIYPGTEEITEDDLVEHLLLLADAGYIVLYSAAGKSLFAIRDWPPVSHAKPSKHPPPADLRRTSGDEPDAFTAWEGESEREGEDRAGIPPSPFCRVHQPAGTRTPCRHCGTARLAHEQWMRERRLEVGDDAAHDL